MRTLKGDHRLTGVDRCARGEVERVLVVQLVDAFEDTQAGADGALGIVAVGDRRPEDRHDRVADELLEHAAVVLDPLLRLRVIELQGLANILGVGAFGSGSKADQVDEQNGDELAFLARRRSLGET